jgi:iron complex transport system substrate-binding protein
MKRRRAATGPGPGLALALTLALTLAACPPALARTITDMDGRTVVVPDAPKRVFALSPPDTKLVYALDPCLLLGWNRPQPRRTAEGWLPPCAADLPVLGGFFGQGLTPDKEALLRAAPDLVVSGSMAAPYQEFATFFTDLDIPVVHVVSDSPEAYPQALRVLGQALGRQERGERLAAYGEQTLAAIRQGLATIPQDKRVTVYYAEGGDGLFTDGRGSFHTQVLDLAGGVNVHPTPQTRRFGMDKVTMETVIGYAPQVILVQDPACRDMILASPLWQDIPAVKNGRVLLIPGRPFNWFDRPPSFMRFLGVKWLAQALYPEVFPYDMVKETREFCRLFLGRDIGEDEARALMAQKQAPRP